MEQISELASRSLPSERDAIRKVLETSPRFKRMGKDADELVTFIMEERNRAFHMSTGMQSNVRGPKERKAMAELDVNVLSRRKA